MGSASSRSSQVQALQAEPAYREIGEKGRIKSSKQRQSSRTAFETQAPPTPRNDIENDTKEFELSSKFKDLEKQLAESESQNLDLQEYIESLQERVEYLNTQNEITKQHENITETLHAKDQYIAKIEKDQQTLQQETAKLKLRYKKRIKHLTVQLNEAKQETSIQMFEMKDEINRLTEENQRLQAIVTSHSPESNNNLEKSDGAMDMGKMRIVFELSNQISEQTDKITELEKNLREKDQLIEKLKNSSSVSMKNGFVKSESRKSKNENILKASYEGDRDTVQTESLRKLSFGMSNYTKSKDDKFDSSDDEELRGLSGASRDSGIGSAKKNGRRESARIPPSRLSTLSDSDWDTDDQPPLQSKIRSAPPEKHAKRALSRVSSLSTKTASDGEDDIISVDDVSSVTSSGKKKKKSALKKQRNKEDGYRRTPVTSVAFENESEYPSVVNKSQKSKNAFFLTQSISPDSTNSGIPVL